MARQKKIVKYVPNTKYPKNSNYYFDAMVKHLDKYNLDDMLQLAEKYFINRNSPTHWGEDNTCRKYYLERFARYDITAENWREAATRKNNYPMNGFVRICYIASSEFDKVNEEFLKEYDEREDLQEFYKRFYSHTRYIDDRWGNSWNTSGYSPPDEQEKVKQFRDKYAERPLDFTMFEVVAGQHEAARWREVNRETPFQPGDLVRLRDPYVGHDDYDPLYVSRYDILHNGKQPTPDKETPRIGTVMKVTEETRRYRAGKGSKLIEVLWLGKEETVYVQERIIKWEERPTKANGLLK